MTDEGFRALFRPTWGRLWVLVVTAPAVWLLWMLVRYDAPAVVGSALCAWWIVAAFWGWAAMGPKPKH